MLIFKVTRARLIHGLTMFAIDFNTYISLKKDCLTGLIRQDHFVPLIEQCYKNIRKVEPDIQHHLTFPKETFKIKIISKASSDE